MPKADATELAPKKSASMSLRHDYALPEGSDVPLSHPYGLRKADTFWESAASPATSRLCRLPNRQLPDKLGCCAKLLPEVVLYLTKRRESLLWASPGGFMHRIRISMVLFRRLCIGHATICVLALPLCAQNLVPPPQNFVLHFEQGAGYTTSLSLGASFTMECWFLLNRPSPGNLIMGKPANPSNTDPFMNYAIGLDQEGTTPVFIQSTGQTGTYRRINAPSAVPFDTWTHVAATLDSGTMKLYINGQLAATGPSAGLPSGAAIPFSLGGGLPAGTVQSLCCSAGVDLRQARVWSRALSAIELRTYATQTLAGSEPGLLADWPLDDGSGSPRDLTAQHRTLTLVSYTRWVAIAPYVGNPNLAPYFTEVKGAFPDLTKYYQALGGNVLCTVVVAADINKDGRNDLILHFWRFQDTNNLVVTTPAPNRLVALISQPDGTFRDATASVFGSDSIDLGGASRKVRVADFNGDGYPDFVYAMNNEDGRAGGGSDASTNWATVAVVMSKGDGTYGVQLIGTPNWYHSVGLADTASGVPDVIAAGFQAPPWEAFRWLNNAWQTWTAHYPHVSASTFLFMPRREGEANSSEVLMDVYDALGAHGVGSRIQQADGSWSDGGAFYFSNERSVNFVSYDGVQNPTAVISLNGSNYVEGPFYESCGFRLTPGASPIGVFKWSPLLIEGPWDGGDLYQTDFPYLIDFNQLLGFTGGGHLSAFPLNITNEQTVLNFNFMDCIDVNGDGYADIVAYPYRAGAKPSIYLNDGKGNLHLFDPDLLPNDGLISPSASAHSSFTALLADVTGDGIRDLIYWPANGASASQPGTILFQLFTGNRPLDPQVSGGTLAIGPAAAFRQVPVAPQSIATAYGSGLSEALLQGSGSPLPTTLAGATVAVQDSLGTTRTAPLYFVSPGQINFVVPAGTSAGAAEVAVETAGGTVSVGQMPVQIVAPALFTLNTANLAAATVLRVGADQTQVFQNVYAVQNGQVVGIPIDFGSDTDQVFVSFYGTGVRSRSDLTNVKVAIGGVDAPVGYAGDQTLYPGMDQINVQVPRSLKGAGTVNIFLTADGVKSNTVTLVF